MLTLLQRGEASVPLADSKIAKVGMVRDGSLVARAAFLERSKREIRLAGDERETSEEPERMTGRER